jgi:hypothetical protein
MARPVGLTLKRKNNDNKKYRENAEWQAGKKLGRPKQVWVWDEPMAVAAGIQPEGHWEKVA